MCLDSNMKLLDQRVGRRGDIKFQTVVQQKISYKHIPNFNLCSSVVVIFGIYIK